MSTLEHEQLPADAAPDEQTTRFLLDRRHFRPDSSSVRPRAFEPAPKDHKTSVFRIKDLAEERIWDIGQLHVAQLRKKPLLARADVSVTAIQSIGLAVECDNHPPRHANICGWPLEKHEWKSVSQELAALASLRLNQQ